MGLTPMNQSRFRSMVVSAPRGNVQTELKGADAEQEGQPGPSTKAKGNRGVRR